MNPEDRSVDEIDAAMERRWAKVRLRPDVNKLRDFLTANGAPKGMMGPTIDLFIDLQKHMEIGHAFFRTVRDPAGLVRLWNSQLSHVCRKRFRFDAETMTAIDALWTTCDAAVKAIPAAGAAAPEQAMPGAAA
jgi:5-methylcytosine-specific restriction protein B